jgi:hypothetical protein
LARVKRAGFEVAGKAIENIGQGASHTARAAQSATASGLEQLQNVSSTAVKATARAAHRATSSGLEQLQNAGTAVVRATSAAIEPGSQTRRAISGAASSTTGALVGTANAAKHVLEVAGPPIVHGAYAAAHVGGRAALAGGHHLGQAAIAGGQAARTAFHYIGDEVVPVVQSLSKKGVEYALEALNATVLHAGDIMKALDEYKPQYSAHNALENGHHEALGNGSDWQRTRTSTPPRKRQATASSSSNYGPAPKKVSGRSYDTAKEWLDYSHNRGVLVEELYKRPNWKEFIQVSKDKNELRQKLHRLSPQDLAEILVKLDHM